MAATPAVLAHVTLTVADLEAAAACYDAALGALGMLRVAELVDEEEDGAAVDAVGWGNEADAAVWLIRGTPTSSGVHLRLLAGSPAEVEAFWAAGLAAGATPRTAPRRWTPYRRGEFSAMLLDPAGNVLEAVAPE